MPEKRLDLILKVSLTESHNSWDGTLRGSFDANVYGYKPAAKYDDHPFDYLVPYESLWARFAMSAAYGRMGLADGGYYAFTYGYEPDDRLIQACSIDRYAKGLKKVSAAYEKRCADNSRPQSLGQEVVYILHAIGCTRIAVRKPDGRPGSQWRDWQVVTGMESIAYRIDRHVADVQQKVKDAAQAVAA